MDKIDGQDRWTDREQYFRWLFYLPYFASASAPGPHFFSLFELKKNKIKCHLLVRIPVRRVNTQGYTQQLRSIMPHMVSVTK